jgi:hypothetical protein
MVFNNTQMGGMDFAFPDVCLTPVPVPTPIPYPNIAAKPMAIPNVFTILNTFMPVHNMLTTVPQTNGDNAGVNMGVASGIVMGPKMNVMGSTCLMEQCIPATMALINPTIQNLTNAPGLGLVPSQVKVMTLR